MRTPRTLSIAVTDAALFDTPAIQALIVLGHAVHHISIAADMVIGKNCYHLTTNTVDLLPMIPPLRATYRKSKAAPRPNRSRR